VQARSTLHWALQGQINTSQGKRASRRIAFASDCRPSPNSLATNSLPWPPGSVILAVM
jgi:hypothetical protein